MLDKTKLIGEKLCRCKNDYKSGGKFYGIILEPELKKCLTIDKHGIIEQHKTFKGFKDSKKLSNFSQYFKMTEG